MRYFRSIRAFTLIVAIVTFSPNFLFAADAVDPAADPSVNMKQLAKAVILYTNEHNGKYPLKLDDLKPFLGDEAGYAQAVKNPRSDEAVGYIYVRPGGSIADVSSAATTVMLYESQKGRKMDNGLLGYADGHVEMPADKLKGAPPTTRGSGAAVQLTGDVQVTLPPAPWVFEPRGSGETQRRFRSSEAGKEDFSLLISSIEKVPEGYVPPPGYGDEVIQTLTTDGAAKGEELLDQKLISDSRFLCNVQFTKKVKGDTVRVFIWDRIVNRRRVRVAAVAPIAAGDSALKALESAGEELALNLTPMGNGTGGAGGTVVGTPTAAPDKPAVTATPPVTPKPVALNPKPGATVKPAPTPAKPDALTEARKLKATNPAEAYAALKAIVSADRSSVDGRAAAQEIAGMEDDAAVAKKVMSGETKAYAALGMAQSFQSAKQTAKASERYQQIIKDFPDTLCAAVARKRLDEIKNPPKPD